MIEIVKNTVARSVLIVTLFSICERFLSFLYRIVLSRNLGAEGMGIYQIVISVFMVFLTVTSSGLPLTVSRRTAEFHTINDKKNEQRCVTSALLIGLTFSLIACIFALCFNDVLSFIFKDERCIPLFMILLPALLVSGVYSSLRGSIWGQKKYFTYSLIELLEEIFLCVSGVILFSFATGLVEKTRAAFIAITLAYVLATVTTIIFYFGKKNKLAIPGKQLFPVLKTSTPITGIRVTSTLMSSAISILLPLRLVMSGMTNEASLSEYGMASGMALPLLYLPSILIGSLALVLIPEISSSLSMKKFDEVNKSVNAALIFAISIGSLGIPFYMVFGTQICELIYGNAGSGLFLRKSAMLMLPMSLFQITNSILNSMGEEKKSFFNFLGGSALSLISIWFLPKHMGINALIIALLAANTFTSIMNIFSINKRIKIDATFPITLTKILSLIIPIVLTLSLVLKLVSSLPIFFVVLIGGIFSVGLIVIFYSICKVIDIKNFLIKFNLQSQKKTKLMKLKK